MCVCMIEEKARKECRMCATIRAPLLTSNPFTRTHAHTPPPNLHYPRGTWTWCRGRELELAGARVAGLVLHLQTGEIYLALAGQKQGHEHTETQKEAWYAAVSHSKPRLTWERAGAVPRETPPPLLSRTLCFIPLGLYPDLILPKPLFLSLCLSRKKGIRRWIKLDMRRWFSGLVQQQWTWRTMIRAVTWLLKLSKYLLNSYRTNPFIYQLGVTHHLKWSATNISLQAYLVFLQ